MRTNITFAIAFPGFVKSIAAERLQLVAHELAVAFGDDILVPAAAVVSCDGQQLLVSTEVERT